jgi:ribosomal protein S18 acetylase RimI-like enzyme/catechol 2,3-dioxygenase-like lactoylglutathione lyase family enzyme
MLPIRPISPNELPVLEDFLYEAIFQPEGAERLPRDIIKAPEIDIYIRDFGKAKGDHCLVADWNGKIVGAVWVRILAGEIKGFGNVDDKTPELAISLLKEYRKHGIGTALIKKMIVLLKEKGYKQVSLSVTKANYAVGMYKKLGFDIIEESKQDCLMLLKMKIEHIAIWVDNIEAMRQFYVTYFEAVSSDKYVNPNRNYTSYFLSFGEDKSRIELMHRPDIVETVGTRGFTTGLAHLAISVGSKTAVNELTERLRADGYTIASETRTSGDGYYESAVLDPEGNYVEITI